VGLKVTRSREYEYAHGSEAPASWDFWSDCWGRELEAEDPNTSVDNTDIILGGGSNTRPVAK
jgi:hypothetical protein